MKWALNEISKKGLIQFDEKLDLNEELTSRSQEVLAASDIQAVGQISYDNGLYLLDYRLTGVLTLPSSRSLKPVDYPLDIQVDEVFASPEFLTESSNLADEDLIIPLEKDLISLDESVADNLLLEIPLQILAEDEKNSDQMPAGKFWSVLSEDDYKKQKAEKEVEKKSPFAGLDGLFDK